MAKIGKNIKAENLITLLKHLTPPPTRQAHTRFDQTKTFPVGCEFLTQNASPAHSSRGKTPKVILGISASGGQRDIFLTGSVSAQRLQMVKSALMGINNVDPWPRKEAPPPSALLRPERRSIHAFFLRSALNALFRTLFMLIQ